MEAKSNTPSPLNTSSADDQFLTASSNISSALTPMDRSQADTDMTKSQLIDWADAESAPGGSPYNTNHTSPAKTPEGANANLQNSANLLDFDENNHQLPLPTSGAVFGTVDGATNAPSTLPVWSPFDQPASTPSSAMPFDWIAAGEEHNPFAALDRKAPDFDPFDLTPSLDQFGPPRNEQAPIALFEAIPAELASPESRETKPTSEPTPKAASTEPMPQSVLLEKTSEPTPKSSPVQEPTPNSTTIVDPTPEVGRTLDPALKQTSTSEPHSGSIQLANPTPEPTRTASEAASPGSPPLKKDDAPSSTGPESGGLPVISDSSAQSATKVTDASSNVAQTGDVKHQESHNRHDSPAGGAANEAQHAANENHSHSAPPAAPSVGATALEGSHSTHQAANQNGTTENDQEGAVGSTKKSFFYSMCCTLL